jgi:hypothetical protein
MAGRNLFADDAAAPRKGRNLFADDPDLQRRNRLRELARASMRQMGGEQPGAGELYADAVTLGIQRPVGGLASAIGGEVRELFGGEPATFGERYRAQTGAYDERLAEAEKNAGWGGTAAKVAGGLTAGGARIGGDVARRAITAAPSLLSQIGVNTGMGAVEGAARNSDSLAGAAGGAALGGATAAGATAALGGLARAPGFRARREAAREAARGTNPEILRNQAQAIYRQLDDAGIAYSNQQSVDLVDDTIGALRGYSPTGVHSPLAGVVEQFRALRGQPVPLQTLQRLREEIGSNAAANEPQVRRIAGELLRGIDGFVSHVDPALSQIPGEQVAPMWREARRLWRSANTAEDIGWRVNKAERRAASTNSGGNVENAIRQNIRQAVDKAEQPRRWNPYSEDELAQMNRVVEGTGLQNRLRDWGNTFGGSGPVPLLGNVSTGGMAGLATMLNGAEPTTAALLGLGAYGTLRGTGRLARNQSAMMAQDQADALMRLITTGSLDRPPPGPPTRADLARYLAGRGGVVAGGEITR